MIKYSVSFFYYIAGPPPFIDTPEDEYPVVVTQNETDRTVLIVQAAAYTKYVIQLVSNKRIVKEDQLLSDVMRSSLS